MLKKIDKYIIKKFLGTFLFSIILIIVIVIVFDISEKIDDFIQKDAPLKLIIFDYYLNFIPYFVNMFSPLFTFISVIFFTSKLAGGSEIIAMLTSGISFKRLLRPYLISAGIICLMSLLLSNFIMPKSNEKRINFEDKYIRSSYNMSDRNLHLQTRPGEFVFFESFNLDNNSGFRFTYEKIKNGKLIYKISSDIIVWDTLSKNWIVKNYVEKHINNFGEKVRLGNEKKIQLHIKPTDLTDKIYNIETMNYFELNEFINKEKIKGTEYIQFYFIEKYKRIAFPFATIILTIIGFTLSSKRTRGGIGLNIGIGITLSFSFILFMQVSTTFATYGTLNPFMAVWIPNIIFGFLSIFLIYKAPK
ncbi:MAG: hypothetical protein A2X12_04185 [Bacteroidetes bacterium GWE2_29_8]|nr:MAG: hypothetical protein A2X12_04185 [Bacteroidetes bacterium GWE2_29_8]